MAYSRIEIQEKVDEALKLPEKAYRRAVWNYRGPRAGDRYTEIAAAYIKDKYLSVLLGIRQILRENYKTTKHGLLISEEYNPEIPLEETKPVDTDQIEKWMAKKLYGKKLNILGRVLDYETPLSRVDSDNAGEIDMLAHNADSGETYIIELKRLGSNETLLRCVLEVFTYWRIAHKENLLKSFGIEGKEPRKVVLADKNSRAYKDLTSEKCAVVRQLMKELQVDFCMLDDTGDNIIEDECQMWETL